MSLFVRRKLGVDATAFGRPPAGRESQSATL